MIREFFQRYPTYDHWVYEVERIFGNDYPDEVQESESGTHWDWLKAYSDAVEPRTFVENAATAIGVSALVKTALD